MKTVQCFSLIAAALLNILAAQSTHANEGSVGNGGDNVEPLFIQAKTDAADIVNAITEENIDSLAINPPFKNWLRNGKLASLQFYVSAMELVFQEAPCQPGPTPRGTCFDNSDPNHPRMIVSREYNRATTPEQAIALVIHEAGHFTGEEDHLFLSTLGVELVQQRAVRATIFTATITRSRNDLDGRYVEGACTTAIRSAAQNAQLACVEAGKPVSRCVVQSSVETGDQYRSAGRTYCTAHAVVHAVVHAL